jgi:hypothetical protein
VQKRKQKTNMDSSSQPAEIGETEREADTAMPNVPLSNSIV